MLWGPRGAEGGLREREGVRGTGPKEGRVKDQARREGKEMAQELVLVLLLLLQKSTCSFGKSSQVLT